MFEGFSTPIDNSGHAMTASVFEKAGLSPLEHGLWRELVLPMLLRIHLNRSNNHRNRVGLAEHKRFMATHSEEVNYDWELFKPKSLDRQGHERVLAEWFVAAKSRHALILDSDTITEESIKAYYLDVENRCELASNQLIKEETSNTTSSELIGLERLVKMRQDIESDQDPETVRQSLLKHLNRKKDKIRGKTDMLPCPLYIQGKILRNIYITSVGDKERSEDWTFESRASSDI